jgi:hypothetical protein
LETKRTATSVLPIQQDSEITAQLFNFRDGTHHELMGVA